MSRPLHLDTQVGVCQNQRYSFIQTPIEMHPSGHNPGLSSPRPAPLDAHVSDSQSATVEQPTQAQGPSAQYIPSEKERQWQQEGIIPTYSKYPPPEQHPAHYAPLEETPSQQALVQIPQPVYNQHSYNRPLNSPGPLSMKANPETAHKSETMTVPPDTNPLQSPISPYYPPPTTTTPSRAIPADDLGTFHQPGQVVHPNQEVQGGTWNNGLCTLSNFGTCCLGMACPCILYGRTQYRLSMKSRKADPTNMLGYETCNASCTVMALLCGCQCESYDLGL